MVVLFLSEFNYYLTTEVAPELFVDTTRGQKLQINVDVTFPHLACACEYLSFSWPGWLHHQHFIPHLSAIEISQLSKAPSTLDASRDTKQIGMRISLL